MSTTGEHASSGGPVPPAASRPGTARKPRFALFVATACGLGYLPKAPGTWGSLMGIGIALLPQWLLYKTLSITQGAGPIHNALTRPHFLHPLLLAQAALIAGVAISGVWSATRSATFWGEHDPQRVVIDEVSGQHLALVVGALLPVRESVYLYLPPNWSVSLVAVGHVLNWKYFLLGLILFRVFDIWKPFPARQAESLPGGWGIMTDDWVAGIYAAIGLWIARAAGL
jgi:phosphatidylglycerophosphatase A